VGYYTGLGAYNFMDDFAYGQTWNPLWYMAKITQDYFPTDLGSTAGYGYGGGANVYRED